jgi:hypothetical protein
MSSNRSEYQKSKEWKEKQIPEEAEDSSSASRNLGTTTVLGEDYNETYASVACLESSSIPKGSAIALPLGILCSRKRVVHTVRIALKMRFQRSWLYYSQHQGSGAVAPVFLFLRLHLPSLPQFYYIEN